MEHRSFVLIQLCKLRTRSVRVGLSSSSIAKTRPFQKTHRSCRCTKKTKSTILCGAEERTATARREELKQKEKREEEDSRVAKTFLETSEDLRRALSSALLLLYSYFDESDSLPHSSIL